MKISFKDAMDFGFGGIKGKSYLTRDEFSRAGAFPGNTFAQTAKVRTGGRHGKIKNSANDHIYFVVDGKGSFLIGTQNFPAGKNDLIIVPKNPPFDYEGKMKLFLVTVPALDKTKEVRLE